MRSFAYSRPRTLAEAIDALAAGGPTARVLAGGTSLYDLMKLDVETPSRVIDLSALSELRRFDTSSPTELVFGALARMADVAEDRRLQTGYPALAESLSKAASQQLRNMATVGGNLLQRTRCSYFRGGEPYACNRRDPGAGCAAQEGLNRGHAILGGSDACIAVYPGDWAVALSAFDAQIDVMGAAGPRTLEMDALHLEPGDTPHQETRLAADEIIVRIRVPVTPTGQASTYHKIRDRESYAFALTSAAVALHSEGGRVRDARIALGGVATRPWRARAAEQSLVGRSLTPAGARAAAEAAFVGARTTAGNRFRLELGIRTVVDALMIAEARA